MSTENKDLSVAFNGSRINIRVGAIIRKNDRILMVRNTMHDYYYSVGGRIKMGETSEEAVVREVFEETGIRMEIDHLAYVHENFFITDAGPHIGMPTYEISFFYVMKVPEDFNPKCDSFTEDGQKEYLEWVVADTPSKLYPDFFRDELRNPTKTVKHVITKDMDGAKRLNNEK